MKVGDLIFASGSTGVILEVLTSESGLRAYQIYFVKNAMRLQPPELQFESSLVGLRLATQAELEADIVYYKATIHQRLTEIRAKFDHQVEILKSNIVP